MIAEGRRRLAPIVDEFVRYAYQHRRPPERLLRRFEIMVLVQADVHPGLVAWFCGCSRATVFRWGRAAEETADLLDGDRPGRPPLFSESTRLKLIAFYCQSPLPGCRGWSVRWAAAYLDEHREILGCAISASSVHRILNAHSLRPHRLKYFLHITDPLFFPKMEVLLRLYADPPPYLFCFDECTGLQALERIGVEMVTDDGLKREFEYKRQGTRDFYGFLHVNTGQVFGRATDNHRQETLVEVFTEHVQQQPQDAELHYICDNLAGHSTELVCRTVAQLAGVDYPTLKTAPERRAWLASEHKRIIFHFTPCHGSWLNQIEIWFGIMQAKAVRGKSFSTNEELGDDMTVFCDTWNEHFAHPFRWTYTGEGLAEKVVCRVTDWLVLQHKQMKRPFLHKQMLLLANLARDYGADVPRKRWQALLQALDDGEDYLTAIIDGEEKVQQALTTLLDDLSARLTSRDLDADPAMIRLPKSVSPSNPPSRCLIPLSTHSEADALPEKVVVPRSCAPTQQVLPPKPTGLWPRLMNKASVVYDHVVMKCQMAVQN
jgi:transposase